MSKRLSLFLSLSSILFCSVFVFMLACQEENGSDTKTDGVGEPVSGFVGDVACQSCHQNEYDQWKGSHHDWAMAHTSDSTVMGDFNDTYFEADSVHYRFFKTGDKFMVNAQGPDGEYHDYEIAYTFGVTPLQQYLIAFPGGKYQTLRATWNVLDQKWYHQYPGDVIASNDWLHWTRGAQNWNTMCSSCHSTNVQKNYNIASDTFNTTYSIINVSCEACHGEGGKHIEWAETNADKEGVAKMISKGDIQDLQIDQCAPCHARRVNLKAAFEHGEPFEDYFRLQNISTQFYHADGQINDEDYVLGSFLQSKMYHEGVKCSDCHNPHSLELKLEGNALCMQCHTPEYNSKKHHFHEDPKATECVSCHMTGKEYMGNDFRRDHSFRIPRPDQSVAHGTPNACTGCHEDRDDKWAASAINNWYGTERVEHFSDWLAPGSTMEDNQKADLLSFINQSQYPAVARGTAMEYYAIMHGPEEFEELIALVKSDEPKVRFEAVSAFLNYGPQERVAVGVEAIYDTDKSVRIRGAELLADIDPTQLGDSHSAQLGKANSEMMDMLKANADFPGGRAQLGDYFLRKGDHTNALRHYEMALKMDSLLTPVHMNLATVYNAIKNNEKAMETLNKLLKIEPANSRAYYLRGLLRSEMGDNDGMLVDLNESIKHDPNNIRAYYNLSIAYQQSKKWSEAETTIKKGLKLLPEFEDGQYLLYLIYSNQGAADKAKEQLNLLIKMFPANQYYPTLVNQ